jgi:hypothetical protein
VIVATVPDLSPIASPHGDALRRRLLRSAVDLGVGQGAERVIDHDRGEIGHAERITLHPRFVQKFGGDDDRRRAAQGFETNTVMRTARCA